MTVGTECWPRELKRSVQVTAVMFMSGFGVGVQQSDETYSLLWFCCRHPPCRLRGPLRRALPCAQASHNLTRVKERAQVTPAPANGVVPQLMHHGSESFKFQEHKWSHESQLTGWMGNSPLTLKVARGPGKDTRTPMRFLITPFMRFLGVFETRR